MITRKTLLTAILTLSIVIAFGQNKTKSDAKSFLNQDVKYKHSTGASLLMLSNLFPDPADYYLLTYGYQLSQKDRIFVEFNTWKYAEPLGTYGNSEEMYPGSVRAMGIGAGYQRFLWKGLFATIEATPFRKQYFDLDGEKIQKGFQLYMQLMVGYRFEVLNKRFYIEPAYAVKYWPLDTNFPTDFAAVDKGTPKSILEPSLNFGYKF